MAALSSRSSSRKNTMAALSSRSHLFLVLFCAAYLASRAAALSCNCSSDYPALSDSRHDRCLTVNTTVAIYCVLEADFSFGRALPHGPDIGSSAELSITTPCGGGDHFNGISATGVLEDDLMVGPPPPCWEKHRARHLPVDLESSKEKNTGTRRARHEERPGQKLSFAYESRGDVGVAYFSCTGATTRSSHIEGFEKHCNKWYQRMDNKTHAYGSRGTVSVARFSCTGAATRSGHSEGFEENCNFKKIRGYATGNGTSFLKTRRFLSGEYGLSAAKQHVAIHGKVASWSWKEKASVVGALAAVSALLGLTCTVAGLLLCCIRKNRRGRSTAAIELEEDDDQSVLQPDLWRGLGPRQFRYSELVAATCNFAEERKIGRGGFGPVYRGYLSDQDRNVAIKVLSREQSEQGLKEFQAEVTVMSHLRHRHIVQLVGWCDSRRGLLLVYELMAGGSLDTHLYSPERLLTWSERYKIALGLGSALLYLHTDCDQRPALQKHE